MERAVALVMLVELELLQFWMKDAAITDSVKGAFVIIG
jgi:hypothetical protein